LLQPTANPFNLNPKTNIIPPAPSHKTATGNAKTNIKKNAKSHVPTRPTITIKGNPVINKLIALSAQARETAASTKTKMDNADADVKKTQSDLKTLEHDIAKHGGTPAKKEKEQQLKTKLTEQQTVAKQARQDFNKANAQAAAADSILYAQQAAVDRGIANGSLRTLDQAYTGLTNVLPNAPAQGEYLGQAQINTLTPKQLAAYNRYVDAQYSADNDMARYHNDLAAHDESYAQLQAYQSDPAQYGTAANDAVAAVNQALGYDALEAPPVIDTHTAQQNVTQTSQDAATWAATLDATSARINVRQVAAQGATDVAVAQKKVTDYETLHHVKLDADDPLMIALKTAQGKATDANNLAMADFGMKSSYLNKLQGNQNVHTAQAQFDQVKATYDKWAEAHPNASASDNPAAKALSTARDDLDMAKQQAGVLDKQFVAAYADLYAAQTDQQLVQADKSRRGPMPRIPW
jgi:hypothetical protein